jgi:signal transduction histidine kinase
MRAPKEKLRVLVIEDHPSDLRLIEETLKQSGLDFSSYHVETEKQFIEGLENFQPSVILSDHGVPGFDSFAALEIARKKAPQVPFIFVTASLGEEMAVRALKTGAADLILKSRLADLPAAVHRAMRDADYGIQRRLADEDMRRRNEDLERRASERTTELEATNKELEAFSYSVSHDLRAPLRHIEGFVEILATTKAPMMDEEARRYLQMISDSARQMGKLIDDLLAFSRMGRAELRKARLATGTLVNEAVAELSREVEGREVQWRIQELPQVEADRALLKQVWTNLLSNALKYTRPRRLAVIEIGSRNGSTGEIIFWVRDNGVGFDNRYANKLFGVFQRLHRAADFEGTGVGLANVRRIVHRHNGCTWAEGEVDKGATFYFSLPAARASDPFDEDAVRPPPPRQRGNGRG